MTGGSEDADERRRIEQLFRRESGRLVAALVRIFGVHNLALAEDVVQDALLRALSVWKFHGIPDNPSAWLLAAARNRALDVLRREGTARRYAPDVTNLLESEWTLVPTVDELLSDHEIKDDELRMMFSCCHPQLAVEGQVALVLNLLSGFGVREIAAAFLVGEAAMEKRIQRAKHTLAASGTLFEVRGASEVAARVPAVRRALYLVFNEGYHGNHAEHTVRVELCEEAMRLCALLLELPAAATPATLALLALMCLHAARLPARVDAAGNLSPLAEQDRSRWDQGLIQRGLALLAGSAHGDSASEYHLEAGIAAEHALAPSTAETSWTRIVQLYDALLELRPSPVVALSRAIAVAELHGPDAGLEALAAIAEHERIEEYPFYAAALGELERRAGRLELARAHFARATKLARSPAEARFLRAREAECGTD